MTAPSNITAALDDQTQKVPAEPLEVPTPLIDRLHGPTILAPWR